MPNTKRAASPKNIAIGKYVLDSISVGMYDNPLMAIREYVQNSVDAIEALEDVRSKAEGSIEITVDGRSRSLKIRDNGAGILASKAEAVLHDLGNSEKDAKTARGFRGMGRLAGLAYCSEVRFTTKHQGEQVVSVSTWDCGKLAKLIGETGGTSDAASAVQSIARFEQGKYVGKVSDHFFVVEMNGIQNAWSPLLNVPAIKAYVSQVAPVPFDQKKFTSASTIDQTLRRSVPLYASFHISVNGEQIFKPYADVLRTRSGSERIEMVVFVPLGSEPRLLACGWLGEWGLSGTLDPCSMVDGIRLRCGNMLVGGKDTLAPLFRERRFNSYMVGELHIVADGLIPNARRDDLEDNLTREEFRGGFIREIGLPYSRKIRELSRDRSLARRTEDAAGLHDRARLIQERGFLAQTQKEQVERTLHELVNNVSDSGERLKVQDSLEALGQARHVLDGLNGGSERVLDAGLDSYKQMFEIIYRAMDDKTKAEAILNKVLNELFG